MTETAIQTKKTNSTLLDKEGKYLTFALANEEYGLEILKVREIFGYMEITAVPQTPHYVKGVINLRGQVIPVIDLRAKFGMETAEVTEETCIIVVEITHSDHNISTGIVVDHVSEVLDIAGEDIEAAPQFGSSVDTSFILGMGKIGESVKILLDIDKVLANVDLDVGQSSVEVRTDESKRSRPKQTQQEEPQDNQPQAEHNQGEVSDDAEQSEGDQTQQEQPHDENAGENPQ